jgi:hypothetical protein
MDDADCGALKLCVDALALIDKTHMRGNQTAASGERLGLIEYGS